MKSKNLIEALAVVGAFAAVSTAFAQQIVKIDGSSTVFPDRKSVV